MPSLGVLPVLREQLDDLFQFEQLLYKRCNVEADLGGVRDGLDKLVSLIAVADDRYTIAGGHGYGCHQFGLEPTSRPMLYFLPKLAIASTT